MISNEGMRVLSSPADSREYKSLQLPNGLRVLLIRDPEIVANDINCLENGAPTAHGELVEDPAGLSGSDSDGGSSDGSDGSDSDGTGSDSGDSNASGGDSEDHEHVRQHHARSPHPSGATKKAAAALSVGVGHYSDPTDLQGLTHYLEHMLFMGSEKYPDENDYDAFLSSHSGSSNACTEEEATTFHFDCAPSALHDALDRFAQFFVAPLIKADALEREVLAVNNEFSGVLQNDSCRLLQLRAHTAKKDHPAAKFGWGNRKSLVDDPAAAGIDVRARLLEHYKQHYSAERMNLVILGGEPMATLEAWATDKFSKVPFGRGERPRFDSFGSPFVGGQVHVLPGVRDEHRLSATFQFPCLQREYKKKSEEYISHLIGHEGRGSLLAALKSRGWATDLCAGVTDQTSAAWLFDISITLTDAGLAAEPGCGLAVAQTLFEYLAMLRGAGVQRWAWDEMASIAQMKWKFLEEEDAADYAAQVAGDMHSFPVEHALAGLYLHEDYDPELITKLLDSMKPETVRLDLQTKDYDLWKAKLADIVGSEASVCSGDEPWFQFPYTAAPLPLAFLESWNATTWADDLALPPKNEYLPSNFELRCDAVQSMGDGAVPEKMVIDGNEEESRGNNGKKVNGVDSTATTTVSRVFSPFPSPPTIAADQPGLRVWHKMDSMFRLPRLTALFKISCPSGYASPRAAALTHLVVKLLEDSLCQESYLAEVAGLHYAVWFSGVQGIDIKVDGFSDKAPLLAGLIFRSLAALQFTDEDFSRIHESLSRTYRNSNMKPMKHATYLRLRALKASQWEIEVVRAELEKITSADVRSFLPQLLGDTHIESLILGNATAEEATAIGEAARCALGASGVAAPTDRTLCLPEGGCSLLLRAAAINPEEENTAVEVYLQTGPVDDPRARAILDLVDQLVYEPCYDTLRTKEQLGYTVSSGPRLTHGIAGFCVVVQSGVHGPLHLDARIDAFLGDFVPRLKGMEDAEFERNREALIANKTMKDRFMAEEADRAWEALINHGRDFHARRDEVDALRTLRREEVESFFESVIAPGGNTRRRMAVHVAGKGHIKEVEEDPVVAGVELVSDVEELKKRLGFYPAVPLKE